ncbi:MAG: glycosyltransferase [Cyanobacteria bacterium]|jgi:glycosyltransferase involved in cell wall biosynthesis|nr:glycosyltransferase [Cyanobacteria bacterium GSL.Bin1]
MKKPLISIVLPVYNRSQYLKQAIESVFNQTYNNWELIIADDASSQDTKSYIDSLNLSQDARIKIFFNKVNIGLFANLNRYIDKAQGEYIILLCSDDYFLPNCLEICVNKINEIAQPSLLLFGRYTINTEGDIINKKTIAYYEKMCDGNSKVFRPEESIPLLLRYGSYNGNITRVFFKKKLFETIGGFKETLKQVGDWEWLYRICKQEHIFISTTPIAAVRLHKEQLSVINFKNNSNSLEVIRMINLLLNDPIIQEWQEAQRWASFQLQFQLWYTLKLLLKGNWNYANQLIMEISKVMSLEKVFFSMIKYLPKRVKSYLNKNELEI